MRGWGRIQGWNSCLEFFSEGLGAWSEWSPHLESPSEDCVAQARALGFRVIGFIPSTVINALKQTHLHITGHLEKAGRGGGENLFGLLIQGLSPGVTLTPLSYIPVPTDSTCHLPLLQDLLLPWGCGFRAEYLEAV